MKSKAFFLFIILFSSASIRVLAQQSKEIDASLLTFNRGKLWHSLSFGKSGPAGFNNWKRTGISLDWPGFDQTKIKEDIGDSPSYMAVGGFYIGCKRKDDSVLTYEDWAIGSYNISDEANSEYIVRKHKKTDNYGLQKASVSGEEVVETIWEYNPNWPNTYEPQRQLPIRVKRTAHVWSGSMRDENYIIYEYVIKNIANELKQYKESRKIVDSLYNFYMMFSYSFNCNSRSWNVLYPALASQTGGARNTIYAIGLDDATKKDFNLGTPRPMIYGWAKDFGYSENMGQSIKSTDGNGKIEIERSGEWLSPGFAGIRLLYSTPDKINKTPTQVNKFGWSAVDENRDPAGPLTGKTGLLNDSYEVIKDPAKAYRSVISTKDPTMGNARLWSLMSLGPWDLMPGDSIVIAVAEIVDGIDYRYATGKDRYKLADQSRVNQEGRSNFEQSSDKAKFTYDNGFRHPNPPIAPSFTVDYYRERERFVANQISWSDITESIPDPDDNTLDLAGYRLYRSEYLPIGPWVKIADIKKGDQNYYSSGKYNFVDSLVEIGNSYYYALTAYDNGKANWSVNPKAKFKESGSANPSMVPPLESSIYANKSHFPFTATLVPPKNLDNVLVVPNPFVIGEGSSQPGDQDVIQFVNIPNPCTIRIYSVRGDLVKTLNVPEGKGAIVSWDQATDYGQYVTSGIYIYHIESKLGEKIGKLAIVR
ncbi:MAG: hypothetical protein Q8933_13005 [Bacteroidota bacterium]|nr:hypothetical protein [Bacteroidota bacterium]MDP4196785.1 hypothetical protein [Bacteroidota bacterium]